MVRLFSYILVAGFAFGAGYFFQLYSQGVPASTFVASSTPQVAAAPALTTVEMKEATSSYTLRVQYPKFAIPSIDSKVEKIVNDVVTEFKALPQNPHDMEMPQNDLTMLFDSPYIGSDLISFKLTASEYTGGAHPNSTTYGLTFDKATGRQLLLNDALQMIGQTLKQVSVAATAQLKERLADGFFPEGVEPNSKNFETFVVSQDKVTFVFQQYQVAPYVSGPQEVSFDRLK